MLSWRYLLRRHEIAWRKLAFSYSDKVYPHILSEKEKNEKIIAALYPRENKMNKLVERVVKTSATRLLIIPKAHFFSTTKQNISNHNTFLHSKLWRNGLIIQTCNKGLFNLSTELSVSSTSVGTSWPLLA